MCVGRGEEEKEREGPRERGKECWEAKVCGGEGVRTGGREGK